VEGIVDESDPISVAGAWVRALVFKDTESRVRIGDVLNEDSLALFLDRAFAIAVRRRFSPGCEVGEITRQILGVRQRYGEMSPGLLEMEMMVRRELGESVPIDDLDSAKVAVIKASVFEQIVHGMGMFDEEIDALVDEAERAARQGDSTQ
jgi:hypothetical protein